MAVKYAEAFKRQLKRLSRKYRHIRTDVQPLLDELGANQTPGEQIQGTGHTVYKARARNTDAKRGKSGGYRVIYHLDDQQNVLLVAVYSKTEQDDIDNETVQRIILEQKQGQS